MQKLLKSIDALQAQIQNFENVNPAVSSSSVGWQIEHSCLVIIKITETVKQSDPSKYQTKFNFKKWFVFITGKFPRGRAQAPASVMPVDAITTESIQTSIQNTKQAIAELVACQKNQYFLHPIFGNLNTPATIYFLAIHTKHHLRIIKDIVS